MLPDLIQDVPNNKLASGIFLGAISLGMGILERSLSNPNHIFSTIRSFSSLFYLSATLSIVPCLPNVEISSIYHLRPHIMFLFCAFKSVIIEIFNGEGGAYVATLTGHLKTTSPRRN